MHGQMRTLFSLLWEEPGAGDGNGAGDVSCFVKELGAGDCGGFGDSKRISTGNSKRKNNHGNNDP